MSPAPNDSSESSPLPLREARRPRSASRGAASRKAGGVRVSMPDNPIQIEIYSRPNCHLCHQAEGVIERVRQRVPRSEEHTSELQSRLHLVCRLLLEKKKKTRKKHNSTVVTRTCR